MLPFIGPVLDIINKFVPDKDKQLELRQSLESEYTKQMALQADVIKQETQSESWLTRNWRPITASLFVGMLVLYFIMYTVVPYVIVICDLDLYINQDPGLNDQLIEVIEICLGGYIGGRSVERVAKAIRK